jgi:beta-aspartyl-peptidase (threonine type)
MGAFAIAIHGGAGTIMRSLMTAEQEKSYLAGLDEAVEAGYNVLAAGGTAVDAVTAATVSLENCVLFNAGRGSVFTATGQHEMDASIMDGNNLEAGAVTGISGVRNPILLAKEIMEHSPHLLFFGEGAIAFAKERGLLFENEEYFFSDFRYQQLKSAQMTDEVKLDHSSTENGAKKFGTVGAVACDQNGNIAAATSTGGMTNKPPGRVGDSPIIGAGTYANNQTCAISCTGHGELFIRTVAAYEVHAQMLYKNISLSAAMEDVVMNKLLVIGGEGGMIGVDAQANVSIQFNSEGMYRGMKHSDGRQTSQVFKDL